MDDEDVRSHGDRPASGPIAPLCVLATEFSDAAHGHGARGLPVGPSGKHTT